MNSWLRGVGVSAKDSFNRPIVISWVNKVSLNCASWRTEAPPSVLIRQLDVTSAHLSGIGRSINPWDTTEMPCFNDGVVTGLFYYK